MRYQVTLGSSAAWATAINWCRDNIDDRHELWSTDFDDDDTARLAFHFYRSEDATMFALIFS